MSAILPMVTARARDVAEALVDRQLLLAADAQRLVELAAALQDVGDLAHRHGARAHVAEALVDRQLLLAADAQRLVELAAALQDVGDLAHGHGARAHVAEALVDRQLLLAADAQRLVELAAALQDVGDLALVSALGVAQALVDRQLLLALMRSASPAVGDLRAMAACAVACGSNALAPRVATTRRADQPLGTAQVERGMCHSRSGIAAGGGRTGTQARLQQTDSAKRVGAFDPRREEAGSSRIARESAPPPRDQRQRLSGRALDPLEPRRAGGTAASSISGSASASSATRAAATPRGSNGKPVMRSATPRPGPAAQRAPGGAGRRVERQRQRPCKRVAGGVRRPVDLTEVVEQPKREQPPDRRCGFSTPSAAPAASSAARGIGTSSANSVAAASWRS